MNNITKQDIEKCVKDVIQQKHIPSEERLRQIVAEEIAKYHEKEEDKEMEGIEAKLIRYKKNGGLKNMFWYILMTLYLFVSMSVLRVCSMYTDAFIENLENVRPVHVILLISVLPIMYLLAIGFVKLYDVLIKRDRKVAKAIIFLLIIFCTEIIWADVIPWIERIF